MNAMIQHAALDTAISHCDVLHVAVIGPAGSGKSALITRLLSQTGASEDDTDPKTVRAASRDIHLLDDPDHGELLRDSITGVAQADAALLVVDASDPARGQTGLYAHLLKLLGIRQIIVVINKLDRVAYDAGRFREIETAVVKELKGFGLAPLDVVPVSARDAEGFIDHGYAAEWYRRTLLEALDRLSPAHTMRRPFIPPASAHTSSVA